MWRAWRHAGWLKFDKWSALECCAWFVVALGVIAALLLRQQWRLQAAVSSYQAAQEGMRRSDAAQLQKAPSQGRGLPWDWHPYGRSPPRRMVLDAYEGEEPKPPPHMAALLGSSSPSHRRSGMPRMVAGGGA